MDLTKKEISFLTIMNETRLSDKKLFKRDSEVFRKVFAFTDEELTSAVKKLLELGLLSKMELGSQEVIYFHTNKVSQENLDAELVSVKHSL